MCVSVQCPLYRALSVVDLATKVQGEVICSLVVLSGENACGRASFARLYTDLT